MGGTPFAGLKGRQIGIRVWLAADVGFGSVSPLIVFFATWELSKTCLTLGIDLAELWPTASSCSATGGCKRVCLLSAVGWPQACSEMWHGCKEDL